MASRTSTQATPGRSDDELMRLWQERVGTVSVPSFNDAPFCRTVNEDSVLNVCLAAGDLNPLWVSEEYGRESSYGANLAPPYMLFALAPWTMHGGVFVSVRDERGQPLPLPGVSGLHGGISIDWRRRLRLGDRITCEARVADARTHEHEAWGRTFELVAEFDFRDAEEEAVGVATFSWLGTERRAVQASADERAAKAWTADEIAEVRAEYARQPEKRRGAEVLYWEDVEAGDELAAIVKGPYTEISYITWCAAFPVRNVHATDEVYWNHAYEEAMLAVPSRGPLGGNELTRQGVPAGHRYHFDYDSAAALGLPAPIDVGNQRVVWLIQLVTMWMGDAGFLKSLRAKHRDVNMMGDLTRCTGVVLGKEVNDSEHLVHCEVTAASHRGPSTVASCTVALPSKERI